jgi:hypothetical protein
VDEVILGLKRLQQDLQQTIRRNRDFLKAAEGRRGKANGNDEGN